MLVCQSAGCREVRLVHHHVSGVAGELGARIGSVKQHICPCLEKVSLRYQECLRVATVSVLTRSGLPKPSFHVDRVSLLLITTQ